MFKFATIPLRQPNAPDSGASHATSNPALDPFAPRIVWRSATAPQGAPNSRRTSGPASLRLLNAADIERIQRRITHRNRNRTRNRARDRARILDGIYVAAALGIALVILWSSR